MSTASGGSLTGLKNCRTSSSLELHSTERILITMWLCTSRSQRSGTKKPGILGIPAGGGALFVPGIRGTRGRSPSAARRCTFGSGACAPFGSGACARRCRSKLTLRGQPRSCTPSSIFLALVASRVQDMSTRPRSASPSAPWVLARTTRTSSTRPYGSNMSRCAGHRTGHAGGAGSTGVCGAS